MSETKDKTSTGLEQNLEALLCYVLGWVTGIIFLLLEKDNKFIRFHAVQSIIVFGAYTVIAIILGFIPIVGWIINLLLGIAAFILWIVLMVKAYNGQMYKLPVAGDIADRNSKPMADNVATNDSKPMTDSKSATDNKTDDKGKDYRQSKHARHYSIGDRNNSFHSWHTNSINSWCPSTGFRCGHHRNYSGYCAADHRLFQVSF